MTTKTKPAAPAARKRIAPKDSSRKLTAIKVLPEELEEIDRRAKRLGLTRTDFMIRKALDQPVGDESYAEQIDDLARRLARVEEVTFGAAAA
jgi:hypothetical protein